MKAYTPRTTRNVTNWMAQPINWETLAENGAMFVTYTVGVKDKMETSVSKEGVTSYQYAENGTSGSVHLREGKEIALLTFGERSIKLKVTKLPEE